MNGWRVTYEIITPESAEDGDVADSGFIDPDGWRTNALIGVETPGVNMSLRNALRFVVPTQDVGRWFIEVDPTRDFVSGAEKYCSLHPPKGITQASYGRVRRLLGIAA